MIPLLLVAASLAHAPATKTVTKSANGTTVTIAPHQLLRIQLDKASDGGFSWETTLKPDPAVLTHRKTIRKPPACQKNPVPCVGGSDTLFFRYVGHAAGRTKLRLGEFQFGRRTSKPAESFRLTVRVR